VVDVTRLFGDDLLESDRATVDAIIESSPVLVLTFREVEHLSAAAIRALVVLHRQVTMYSRRLFLVVPLEKAFIREVFEITRLDTLLDICDSEPEALDRIRS
jgi:anti-anti-sigma regulatory factor